MACRMLATNACLASAVAAGGPGAAAWAARAAAGSPIITGCLIIVQILFHHMVAHHVHLAGVHWGQPLGPSRFAAASTVATWVCLLTYCMHLGVVAGSWFPRSAFRLPPGPRVHRQTLSGPWVIVLWQASIQANLKWLCAPLGVSVLCCFALLQQAMRTYHLHDSAMCLNGISMMDAGN